MMLKRLSFLIKKTKNAGFSCVAVFFLALFFISPVATAQNTTSEQESPESAFKRKIEVRARELRKILSEKKDEELEWWRKEYQVSIVEKPIQRDSFYRWSGVQILNMAFGGSGGTEPIPEFLSKKLLTYLEKQGFSNADDGGIFSFKGESEDLKNIGVEMLRVDKFVKSMNLSKSSSSSIFHVSFFMEYYNLYGGEGGLIAAYRRAHSNEPGKKPIVFYREIISESNGDFIVLGIPNSVLENVPCEAVDILAAKCTPAFGQFKVDYFHFGK